jgi:hypothetical protein
MMSVLFLDAHGETSSEENMHAESWSSKCSFLLEIDLHRSLLLARTSLLDLCHFIKETKMFCTSSLWRLTVTCVADEADPVGEGENGSW